MASHEAGANLFMSLQNAFMAFEALTDHPCLPVLAVGKVPENRNIRCVHQALVESCHTVGTEISTR